MLMEVGIDRSGRVHAVRSTNARMEEAKNGLVPLLATLVSPYLTYVLYGILSRRLIR
jgi:hypothetical protein